MAHPTFARHSQAPDGAPDARRPRRRGQVKLALDGLAPTPSPVHDLQRLIEESIDASQRPSPMPRATLAYLLIATAIAWAGVALGLRAALG